MQAGAMIDDELTTDKHEGVYDAMMVTLPTVPQSTGFFEIAMTLYEKETQSEYSTQTLKLACADYALLSTNGFRKGTRTYFCIDILEYNALHLKGVQVAD